MPRPMLFLLPDPGSGAGSWDDVITALGDRFDVVEVGPLEVGDRSGAAGSDVRAAAERVAEAVREHEPDVWLVAGHRRGGAVATAVTAWAEQGERSLIAPVGLVVVDAPEPTADGIEVRRTPTAVVGGAEDDVLREQPRDVAARIVDLADASADRPLLPPAFARLIASDRVAARTRRAMLDRLDEPDAAPRALTASQRALLTAVLARVVPQRGTDLDLAGRIDAALATGSGDGWRFAELPPDAEAWRRGLDTVAELVPDFAMLDVAAQEDVLDRVAAGGVGSEAEHLLSGERMALWFQDVRAEAVRTWLSHPAAQAWIRYDGFADGGDGPDKQGFTTTHAGEWEAWQRDWRTGEELRA